MPRDTRLALWPEQTAYYPLSNSWAEIKNTSTLDFSHCCGVHSCGLAATALNLHWLFNSHSSKEEERVVTPQPKQLGLFSERESSENLCTLIDSEKDKIEVIVDHVDHELMKVSESLGFFECIKQRLTDDLRDKYCSHVHIRPICTYYFSVRALSYPIYHFNFAKYPDRRRDVLEDLFDYTEPIFDEIFKKNQDRGNQLIHVLEEIAKNIADHANADGFMGLDVVYSHNKTTISILIGDLGPGIYKHFSNAATAKNPSRQGKMGFAEAYKFALTNEVSGSINPENYGCGMSSIVNNCIGLHARISVVDQQSRLSLSSLPPIDQTPPSHNALWRSSFRFDGKKPFFYFIECEEPLL
jgi:hypothetical protein